MKMICFENSSQSMQQINLHKRGLVLPCRATALSHKILTHSFASTCPLPIPYHRLNFVDPVEGQHAVQCDIVFALVIVHRHAAAALATMSNDPKGQNLDVVA